ncbi:MSHA biogenesis protein MshJ [Photobacterium jeanii]|uniref:MSHA biogenesis protein MshJ n=1 Tax=Photobacterium jeanii TaxID=858640 RepID=A0A178KGW8_9GAMM|nr:type II secretion system protein GspM [Photobacterium jeanii]OAN16507.1 MSHA biogenesis protein MshJ [Photobacterium jeanii]PST87901.1 MSHA biogenesis protein MshJ [Photobacterium jeanii]
MSNYWYQLVDRFDELSQREQILIFISGWVALLFVGFIVVLEPQMNQLANAKLQVINTTNQLINSDNQITLMSRKLSQDPDVEVDQKIADLRVVNRQLNQQLEGRVGSLVTPVQMSSLMEDVLRRSERLKLVSLQSMPSVQLISGDDEGYYIHPVQLNLRGRYFDVVNYLQQLEELPVKYYWQSLNYQVDRYPWADIQLNVYTLGESKDFIGG